MGKYRNLLCLAAAAGFVWSMAGKPSGASAFLPEVRAGTTAAATQAQVLEFPLVLRCGTLVGECLASYEGERPGGEPMVDVSALMVYNPGPKGVRDAEVTLMQGGTALHFSINCIPPGSRVLVMERDRKPYSREPVTAFSCTPGEPADFADARGIAVRETDDGLTVENQTGEDCTLVLHYKSYYAPDNFFLGGESRSAVIADLGPGEVRRVQPGDYAPGYTKVVWVEKKG